MIEFQKPESDAPHSFPASDYYTLFATKQEDFDSVEVPAKRASSS